jgi:predicted transcriptional regulator
MAARRAEVVRLTVEGLSQKDIAKRLGIGPAAVRNDQRKSGVKPSRDTEDAELNGRAGAVTDAWAKTQAAGLVSDQGRHSVHQLVKRVLAAGQFDDDATGAALLRLADRGIAPTAAALGRELTGPAHANGKGSSQQRHQPYRAPADQSVYDRGFTKR